jgi:hypothetical protein
VSSSSSSSSSTYVSLCDWVSSSCVFLCACLLSGHAPGVISSWGSPGHCCQPTAASVSSSSSIYVFYCDWVSSS